MQTKSFSPALVLYLLAPIIAELISGSSPPLKFFHPLSLIFLPALYGSAAILIRELTVRWHKGWPTILLLGAAFGIVNEGLLVKSFFDTAWPDLGVLATYGRWLGVNWVWGVELTIYHAVFSIGIPILLTNLLFPKQQGIPWVSQRTFTLLAVLLSITVILGFFFISPYRPPLVLYTIALLLVIVLVVIARRLPRTLVLYYGNAVARPLAFAIVGFVATVLFFIINWILPHTFIPAPVPIALTVLLAFYTARTILSMSGNAINWTPQHQLALVWGALTFFILISPITELFPRGGRNGTGMVFVALITLAALIMLWIWLGSKSQTATNR